VLGSLLVTLCMDDFLVDRDLEVTGE
jgi:hypothetical protein